MPLTPPKLNRGNIKGALIFVAAMLLSAWGAAIIHEVLGHALVGYLMGVPIERVELVPQLLLRGINSGFVQFVEFGPGALMTLKKTQFKPSRTPAGRGDTGK